jgi:UDP-2-acetamido-2,6-beta-L-arabino-hexul-4-ose reductase
MNILVTGSNGFIGKNLIENLSRIEEIKIYEFDKENTLDEVKSYINDIDFIFHFAGVNRPEKISEFYEGNNGLTESIIKIIENNNKKIPILISSSIQAQNDNDYGKSKFKSEELLKEYSKNNDVDVFIYRLPNVFGKWSRPNYNSVISTWCYNITHDLEIKVNDESTLLNLVYIDDVIEQFVKHLNRNNVKTEVSIVYKKTLGEIKTLLEDFKNSRENLIIPKVGNNFERALYSTYLSYLPTDKFSYEINGYSDERGTFYELLKTLDSGQISISTSKPGVTRGNHYHNSKNEKFLVIKGKAVIKLRKIDSDEEIVYNVSEDKMEIVDMIPGYTHNITNIGDTEMVLLIWANEQFDREKPDTYYQEV